MPRSELRIDVVGLDAVRAMNAELLKSGEAVEALKQSANEPKGLFAPLSRSSGVLLAGRRGIVGCAASAANCSFHIASCSTGSAHC